MWVYKNCFFGVLLWFGCVTVDNHFESIGDRIKEKGLPAKGCGAVSDKKEMIIVSNLADRVIVSM
jgi:hypothetical protein